MKVGTAKCYTCPEQAVGAGAYCAACQPPSPPQPQGKQCLCAQCGEKFTTVTSFDAHQTLNTRTGKVTCKDPRDMRGRSGARLLVLTKRGWGMNPERSNAPANKWWEKRQA